MTRSAGSTSRFAAELIAGPVRPGVAVGHGFALFDNDVLALTRPGAPRMPNGIETDVVLTVGEALFVGDGELRTATAAVAAGRPWQARPFPRVALSARPEVRVEPDRLLGWGAGLTPLGDDILVGYLAGLALTGRAAPPIECGPDRTTALSRTLLSLAALGELPEPAHRLLEEGDPEPLLRFGSTSGKGIVLGLAAAAAPAAAPLLRRFTVGVSLPDGAHVFQLLVSAAGPEASRAARRRSHARTHGGRGPSRGRSPI